MNIRQLGFSRRSITTVAALVGLVSLAIGAHAALNKRTLDAARVTEAAAISRQEHKAPRHDAASRWSWLTAIHSSTVSQSAPRGAA